MLSKNIYPMNNLPNFSMKDSKQNEIKVLINQNNLLIHQIIYYNQDNNNCNNSCKNINYKMNKTNQFEDLQNNGIK